MIDTILRLTEDGYSVQIDFDSPMRATYISMTKEGIGVHRCITFIELKQLKGYSYDWIMCRILTQLKAEIDSHLIEMEKIL